MSYDEATERAALARRLFLGQHDMLWKERAACQGEDPRLFWTRHLEAHAKLICGGCPVIDQCLAHALEVGETGAVWGGLTDRERHRLKRGVPWMRLCGWCNDEFFWVPKPGRPPAFCSERCHDAARYVQQTESDSRRKQHYGMMHDRGHGVISRYQSGCRCPACRRASRVHRANARKAS